MVYQKPITELIRQRYSCRTYQDVPIEEGKRRALAEFAASRRAGPLGSALRFLLIAAGEEDRTALRGLGTYGFIRGAPAFVAGAVRAGAKALEDFGYCMEEVVLLATDLGLGTCWLGGTFTKSTFARKVALDQGEVLPAVVAVGHAAGRRTLMDRLVRRSARGDTRLPWEQLFFEQNFGRPLGPEEAGAYAAPLEMVRLAPSASNKQPWRIVRQGRAWHFFLQRTPAYSRSVRLFMGADLQRVDMGIAMGHFALTAAEVGLAGRWVVDEPALARPDEGIEYVVSWIEDWPAA